MLELELARGGHERVNLRQSVVFVAEEDGEMVGSLSARLIWQLEPLHIWARAKSSQRKAAFMLPKAMEAYIGDRALNKTGIFSYFFVTKGRKWAKLAEHFGCLRIYKRCMTFARDL